MEPIPVFADMSGVISRVFPLLIPITAVIGAFAVAIVAMILKSREKERDQKERMLYIEKGLEVPKELLARLEGEESKEPKPRDFRSSRAWLILLGVVMICIGAGVMIMLGFQEGPHEAVNGIVPLFIGIGFLVTERLIATFLVTRGKQ